MDPDILARNNVHIVGRGTETLMLAHGFGCDQTMWRFIAPAFEDSHRIVLFDYVGCGKSDPIGYTAERYGTLEGYARDVLDICRAAELRDVIFVGHSVSAIIGILAAKKEPSLFKEFIMIGPSPRYINQPPDYVGGFDRADVDGLLDLMDKNYLGWARFLAPVIMQNEDRPELQGELERSFCAMDPDISRRFAQVTFLSDNRADLAKVNVPSLIMQCSNDAIAPAQVGEYVHRHMPASTMRLLKATGHCPHLSHPAETIAVMKEYLAAGTSPRSSR
jgi:sigma-B regulation protein RsbQ